MGILTKPDDLTTVDLEPRVDTAMSKSKRNRRNWKNKQKKANDEQVNQTTFSPEKSAKIKENKPYKPNKKKDRKTAKVADSKNVDLDKSTHSKRVVSNVGIPKKKEIENILTKPDDLTTVDLEPMVDTAMSKSKRNRRNWKNKQKQKKASDEQVNQKTFSPEKSAKITEINLISLT